ncbi:hypothetical protein NVP1215B_061 [Vibrio phage 1.215.B._10N.222.54.F7]|nr:hypothetical protein NVP1215A_061 [Vibrio phage 1.215.A._10N.222.54.F7]AUR96084.1 hypothetical protein NVP1215B_061 [Vibrio phage 1.215.B._10N.222.54.F7]
MKQQKRKEIESSLHGLIVKRFNHYLYKQRVAVNRALSALKSSDIDSSHLQQRLALNANNLDRAITSKKSNEWAIDGLERIKLANTLIEDADAINGGLRGYVADSKTLKVKYELNLALLLEGIGSLGDVKRSGHERRAVDYLITAANTLNNDSEEYRKEIGLLMDRVKTLNWLEQSTHVTNYAFLWSSAVNASVLTLSLMLQTPRVRSHPKAAKLEQQLAFLLNYERELLEGKL